ncbi:hypothetical protein [Streptomyces sp. NPDC054958]
MDARPKKCAPTVLVARDETGLAALLTSRFPCHGGDFLFLSGGAWNPGKAPRRAPFMSSARESGSPPPSGPLGAYAITVDATARLPPLLR